MTDKKFTDEEIIKSLKCMLKMLNNNIVFSLECGGCAFGNNGLCSEICSKGVMKVTLDLINHQKAEIERYKRYYYQHEYDKWEKQIKAESYKEFAERIRECCDLNNDLSTDAWLSVTADIDCVLKEMTGE